MMRKRLIILGAGGFGREVAMWADAIPQKEWSVAGFLDDNGQALDGFSPAYPILGTISQYQPSADEVFVCAIGDPRAKDQICARYQQINARFISLIHPSAIVGTRSSIGTGCILCPYTIVSCDVRMDDFVLVNMHSSIGHDVSIGRASTLLCHVDVTGGVRLGQRVLVGSHASLLPKTVVGDDAVVGAGSVVVRNVAPGITVLGAPARKLL